MSTLHRRDILRAAAAGVLGASFLKFEDTARAAEGPEHFFLFIELQGGIAWNLATDARDLDRLPMNDPRIVKTIELKADASTPPFTSEESRALLNAPGAKALHGNFIVLPYIRSLAESYRKGTTNQGCAWRLGLSGDPLEPHVNDIAVVRGVRNIHNFHGGANDEIFSGIFNDRADQKKKHIAGTISSHLSRERGSLLLDNVVFEGATFSGRSGNDFLAPTKIDVRSLGMLAATQGSGGSTGVSGTAAAAQRFANARQLADAVGGVSPLGPQHREAFEAYLSALQKGPAVQKRLAEIADRLQTTEASLDLDVQVDTALTLFQTGLTRVATLCIGAPNSTNNVDRNGLFDAHYGYFHKAPEGAQRAKTYGHYLNVRTVMKSLARLIAQLKSTTLNGKSLFEQTTVVMSTDFSRTSNFAGNEDSGPRLGAGHYYFNNDFILFGKGVKGGAWVGDNDPVTQYAYLTKMATLDQSDPNAIGYSIPSFFTLNTTTNVRNVPSDARIEGLSCESQIKFVGGEERPMMPKDIMRTLYTIAGVDPKFRESYGGNWFSDARTIRPILA
jgi:hypothetical protein